jgi:lipopolysaccharide export LptBFGC system permease protein LptF
MVFTLQRYIFRELLKVFVLSAVALTVMMSLGSVLRPIQQYGASPRQVIYLIGYFLPITLTFVLPMAALFSASLVYGRFASDNELDACRASGISLPTLVYPGFALAVVVAIANLILSFYVMPIFIQLAEKSLRSDVKQILYRNLQRKGFYEMPPDERYRIYADVVDTQKDMLGGLVVTELKNNKIRKVISADKAKLQFNPHERFNEIQIIAYNVFQISEEEGGFFFEKLPVRSEFGSLIADDIKFKKVDEMKKIKLDLMRFYPIARLARDSYAQLTAELLAQEISKQLVAEPNSTYKLYSAARIIEFDAENCFLPEEKEIELAGPVTAKEYDTTDKRLIRTLEAAKAKLYIVGDELAPTLTMELYNPTYSYLNGEQGIAAVRLRIRGLVLPQTISSKLNSTDILSSISDSSINSILDKGPSPRLKALTAGLHREINKTLIEIEAEMHSRLVFGIGCVLMIMIGIGLGIVFKDGHLLSAFGASSIPAAVLIICIIAGKNVTKNPGVGFNTGLVLMWSGLVFLFALVCAIYQRLLRN